MVFESLVVDLINKYLGDYVENLDKSQLKLGIWGGDAVLQNLDVKESALDDLDLPVKIKAGHIGKLTLKIPWKNLYTEPVVASVDGLYALAVPNVAVKYNEEKEEKSKQEAKQKKLQQIEEAKKLAQEQNKPKEPQKDSFAEKMATQIIKNLQIHVKNIHVRYEDKYTNPNRPFSIGITLGELLFQTTDENWKPCVVKEAVTQIYKLVKLDSLAVYWNSKTLCLDGQGRENILNMLKTDIGGSGGDKKVQHQYLIKPISSAAHLRLNTKPEKEKFTIPKVFLTIVFDDIAVGLSKLQYDDVLEMLESFERMALLSLHRKYRPEESLHKHASKWWHYAYKCVLEETVRRRHRMWSWSHISKHRQTMKRYKEAYIKKLDSKKVPSDIQKILDECEKVLDVFNITIMRQQAEVEAAKLGAKRKEEKSGGWFGGWFGGKKKKEQPEEGQDIKDQFKELYTPDEKAKLYSAIGYEENEADLTLPKEYVAVRLVTKFTNVGLTIKDDAKKDPQILKLQLKDVYASVGQRPAASAVQVEAKIDGFTMHGSPQNGHAPKMVLSQNTDADQVYSLLNVQAETNPLDGQCDTRVRVNARPLQIMYDAITVNQIAEFFKPPEQVYLNQLSKAAMAKFEEIKEQSATGLQHAIEQRKYTDIGVDLMSSYVIMPEGGIYKKNVKMLVLDLGNLKVNSEKNQSASIEGKIETVEEVMKRAYDKFNIKLDRIQLMFAHPGEDWQSARKVGRSSMHILNPISINVVLQKCMFDKDPRMAKMKVSGELPLLSLTLSDKQLIEVKELAESIPLPESEPVDETEVIFKDDAVITDLNKNTIIKTATSVLSTTEEEESKTDLQRSQSQDLINAVDMELKFEVKESAPLRLHGLTIRLMDFLKELIKLKQPKVSSRYHRVISFSSMAKVNVNILQRENNIDVPVLKLVVETVGTEVTMRSFDMGVEAYVGGIYVQHQKFKASEKLTKELKNVQAMSGGPLINLINTPATEDNQTRLLSVSYLKAKPDGPEFLTTYKNTEQTISVTFRSLEVLLHQEAILNLMEFGESLQAQISSPSVKAESKKKDEETQSKKEDKSKPGSKKKKKQSDAEKIDILVNAKLEEFGVAVCTEEKLLTDIKIKGIKAGVTLQEDKTCVTAELKAITVFDPDPDTLYSMIMEIEGEAVLQSKIIIYNGATDGDNYSDMSCVDTSVDVTLGCIRLYFLNKFVNDLLAFLNNFQTAKDQLKKAGDAVAEYSKEAVQKLQEKAPRVGLKIDMSAPKIIVPQNSKSNNVLLADFGHLEIQNSFQMPGKNSESGYPAVLDAMKIKLTELKLTRGITAPSGSVHGESCILEPVSVELSVTRNLSIGWYKDKPEIDITGTMEAIVTCISQGDFTMLMLVLNENLTEGQTVPESDVYSSTGRLSDAEVMESHVLPPAPVEHSASKEEPYDKMTFSFQIKSLSAALYTGESDLKTVGISTRDPATSLGKVELQVIAVEGKMMSDGSMTTKVILKDTVLDDTRLPKQGGITRMIQRSSQRNMGIIPETSSTDSSNMIDVSFTQESNKDKNITVAVSSLHICVCLDYLMSLGDFFTKGMPQTKPQPVKQDTTKATSKKSKALKAQPSPPPPPPEGEMNIMVSLGKPEIILIEDQSNQASNALVLNTELSFRMRVCPETQDMSANIKDLQIISCLFNNRQSGSQILNPCEISFYSKTPHGKGAHMDIATTDLILNISPATIKTMSAIAAGLSKQSDEGEQKKKTEIPTDLWAIKKVSECNFWYLKSAEEGEEVDTEMEVSDMEEVTREEQLIARVPSIVLKLEGGVGKRTVPLLIVEAAFEGEVKNWSTKLGVESVLKLEVAYYNEKLTVWEPLLEPVQEEGKFRRWELGLEVKMNDDDIPAPEDETDTVDIVMPPAKMSVNIRSQDALQLMMSKTCLEVLTNLGTAFGDAYKLVEPAEKAGEVLAPYVINNYTGIELTMKLDNAFEMPEDGVNGMVKMGPSRQLPLAVKTKPTLTKKSSVIKSTQEGDEKRIIFEIMEYNCTREIVIKRAEKRLYQINNKTYPGDIWSVVISTDSHIGQKIVSLRSIIQMKSHLTIPVEIFYKNEQKSMETCGIVQPGELINLPFSAVYTPAGEFFFKPILHGDTDFQVSKEPVCWRDAEKIGNKQISCDGAEGHSPYYLFVRPEIENIYFDQSDQQTAKTYIFHLSPTVILHNLLPVPIKFMLEGTSDYIDLQKGENIPLAHACVGKSNLELIIPSYMNKEWVGHRCLQSDIPEMSMWTFEAYVGAQKVNMDLGLHCKRTSGCMDISVYCPYWMINKTGQTLSFKGGDEDLFEHPESYKDVVMFSFKQKTLFGPKKKKNRKTLQSALAEPAYVVNTTLQPGEMDQYRGQMTWKEGKDKNEKDDKKKVKEWKQSGKASLKIGETDWSDKFSLDTVGSAGSVQCKSKTRTYEVGVMITLSKSGLTKIVTFTPFYMILNTAELPILCTEATDADSWIEVAPGECLPFWPEKTGKEMSMKAKFKHSSVITAPFLFNSAHTTLMRLEDEHGGISVECQVTESAMVTTLCQYKPGMATVLLINHTDKANIQFQQSGVKTVHILGPDQCMLYTWELPTGKREIQWTCGDKKNQKNDLIQDGIDAFFLDSDTKIYWVSFLDGMQRVLLFTEDLAIATIAQEAGELERIEQEINLCIQGMGLSLVNDNKQMEVAFMGITSSGIIWEEKRKRYKALNIKSCTSLENAYQKYMLELASGHNPPAKLHLDNKMEVNFSEMMMYKPNKRAIRRSFQDGIWVQYKTSPHQVQLHAKINRLQLDNQVSGAVFPTVLSPLPPPKSVAAESVPKPFTEVSIMMRKHEHSKMLQFKYFKVLIQEMTLKLDQGFLNNVIDLFAANKEVSREQETTLFKEDCKKVDVPLLDEVGLSLAEEQKNFYDHLHFSPIKLHLSFSLQGGGGDGKPTQIHAEFINIFLQSVGVVLTDVQDVVFKLGFFQRDHSFYNQSQLVGEMSRHYAGQAIKQMYVLVLGLDVLGNPFGLIRGVAEGIEDLFYEPYQGAIQGPEEFAEGLALGVRSLFGHAIGGAAGAVSRITGTLGKGLAALTLDDDYQKKRREAMNKRPANVREGFARGGKGLVMGVFDGVTGIVRKPVEGAQKEGVEGFFKGIGKGLVGVVTRPTSGVIDFASSSFEGIRRIAEMSDEVRRLRPPRRFHADNVIRPYNLQEAEGYAILHETEKGKFAETDDYVAHVVVSKDGKHVFIVTDKRVIYANRGEIFGHWDADWTFTWTEIKDDPKQTNKGIEIHLKEKEKKKFLFGSSSAKKEVVIHDPKLSEWIVNKILEAKKRYQ